VIGRRLLRPSLLALALGAPALVGCGGGGDDSTTSTSPSAGGTSTATPAATTPDGSRTTAKELPPPEDCGVARDKLASKNIELRAVGNGKAATVTVGGTRAEATVVSARRTKRVSDGKHSETPARGVFVVVRFQAENTGKDDATVLNETAKQFVVLGNRGRVFGRVHGCPARKIEERAAQADDLNAKVAPGDQATGVAVYVVPKGATNLRWANRTTGQYFPLPAGG